jgi:hypothetical protein
MNFQKIIGLIIGIILLLIIYEIIRIGTLKKCPKPYIEYRYVPRSFKDEQDEPVPIADIFNKMFAKPSPWMMSRGIGINDRRDTGLANKKMKV